MEFYESSVEKMEVARPEESQSVSLSTEPPVLTKENEEAEIEPEFLIKHPLQNTWNLWYQVQGKGRDWGDALKIITSFDTVEDFWSVYHHIKQASEIRQGADYSLFKDPISPTWEHPSNQTGGRWLITMDRKLRGSDLDRIWLEVCLSLIGETFENNDEICGVVLNVRAKQDKVGIWMKDCTKSSAITEIGKKLKEKLKLGQRFLIVFQSHKDCEKSGSAIRSMYTL